MLRAIAGLWLNGNGDMGCDRHVFFLPQRLYCPPGTLHGQLLYPSAEPMGEYVPIASQLSDDDLLNILISIDLPDLATRVGDGDPIIGINMALDWSHTLLLGKQHCLAFGTLLVNWLSLILMDASTSALDNVSERKYVYIIERTSSLANWKSHYICHCWPLGRNTSIS